VGAGQLDPPRDPGKGQGLKDPHRGLRHSDRTALGDSVRRARSLNPGLFMLARTRYLSEFDDLQKCGADAAVAEDFGSAAEILRAVLMHLHLPGNVIRAEMQRLHQEAYPHTGQPTAAPTAPLQSQNQSRIDTFLLQPEHAGAGAILAEMDLRGGAGVRVVAQVRGEEVTAPPGEGAKLAARDVLVLAGRTEAVGTGVPPSRRPPRQDLT